MALCEAAAFYKGQGKTLWDVMMDMYEKYGYYVDDIKTVTLKGVEGSQSAIVATMASLSLACVPIRQP